MHRVKLTAALLLVAFVVPKAKTHTALLRRAKQ